MNTLRRYAPAVLLGALVLWMSGARGSATATGSWAEPLMGWLGISPDLAAVLHAVFRKLGHLSVYGFFAVLTLRALRGERPPTWRLALAALGFAVLLAGTDETLQSFSPERGGSPLDVLLDACGAAIALYLVLPASARRRRSA